MKKGVFLLASLISSLHLASAYIDPGMGVAVGSTLWAYIASFVAIALAFLTRVFIDPIKRFFKSFKK